MSRISEEKFTDVNHFDVLDLKDNCTDEDVKKAYLKLAKQWHPDVNKSPEASSKFKLISEANELLNDHVKRSHYRARLEGLKYGNSSTYSSSHGEYDRTVYQSYYEQFREENQQRTSSSSYSFRWQYRSKAHRTSGALFMFAFPFLGVAALLGFILSNNKKKNKSISNNNDSSHSQYNPSGNNMINNNSIPNSKKSDAMVEAWYNPRSKRWETPAPWSEEYRKAAATTPNRFVDRMLVHDSNSPNAKR